MIQYTAIFVLMVLHSLAVSVILSGPSEHKLAWIGLITSGALGIAIAFGESFPAKKR